MRGESTFAGHLGTFSPTLLYLSVHGGLIAAGLVSIAMHKTRRLLGFAKRLLFSSAWRSCSRRRVEKRKEKRITGESGGRNGKLTFRLSARRLLFSAISAKNLARHKLLLLLCSKISLLFSEDSFSGRGQRTHTGSSLVSRNYLTDSSGFLGHLVTLSRPSVSPAIFSSSSRRNVFRLLFVLVLMR